MTGVIQYMCDRAPREDKYWTTYLEDDFYNYTTAGPWTTKSLSSGSCVFDNTTFNTGVLLTTAASLNDYEAIRTTNKVFLPVANQNTHALVRFNYLNQASGNASIYFGFASVDTFPPSGGGDNATSMSSMLIYKKSSSTLTNWYASVSNAGTQTVSQASTTSAADGTYVLEIDIINSDSLTGVMIPKVNGVQLRDSNNLPIKLTFLYASLAAQYLIFAVEAGSGNVQTAAVDLLIGESFRL